MWWKKKDSSERSIILENFASRNNFNAMIDSKDGFSCNHHQYSYSFLSSCHLCHKPLSLGKEIYMYRGEMGFCSEECRNRQMYLDDMKKIEISTRRILASFRESRRHGGSRCETRCIGRVVSAAAPPIFHLEVDKLITTSVSS